MRISCGDICDFIHSMQEAAHGAASADVRRCEARQTLAFIVVDYRKTRLLPT